MNSGLHMEFPWEILNGPPLGDLEGCWSENEMVRCSGGQMEFWLGGQKKGVTWSKGRVQGP